MTAPEVTTKTAEPRRTAYVQSLQRGVAVLDVLAASSRPQNAREVAVAAGLDRTITYRILRTLEKEGLVEAAPGGFQLGGKVLLLGNAYLDNLNVRRVALPYTLGLLHGELKGLKISMSLFVAVGAIVTIIDQLRSPEAPLDIIRGVGTRLPIDRTAAGRCLLAYMSPDEVVRLVGAERAAELAPRFVEILAADGVDFATSAEPHGRPGISALSAVIRDRAGAAVACLSVSGIEIEQYANRQSHIASLLRRNADQIGLSLR
ncbi:MAG: IclR family transcriptional regulator [Caulobacteraceae bacterium]|nr:IclR family transcriptional regulator [Caulobacteraceae bacterium]